ncbi:MAG: ParA family protein, partial [Phycisphaeraceae bacterium]
MDQPSNTTEPAETTAHNEGGPYGSVPMPEKPVVVEATDAMDDDAVPEPAWVEQQRKEEAEAEAPAETPAEVASAAGSAEPSEPNEPTQPAEPDTPTLPTLEALPAPASPRRMALINQKGGVGKTTTTVNLGAALAASGLRVLMIDLDPQAHLTLSLGIDPEELDLTIYDLFTDSEVSAAEVVRTVDGCSRLVVLAADTNLAGIESELAEMVKTGLAQTLLRNKCAELIKQFDYVLIDCPPSLGLLTINGLTCA